MNFFQGFCHVRRWKDAEETRRAVQISGMQQADTCRGTVL